MYNSPRASHALTIRVKLPNRPGMLAQVTSVIGRRGGNIGAIDIVRAEEDALVRDVTVNTASPEEGDGIVAALRELEAIELIDISDRTFLMHLGGKLEVKSRSPIKTREELSQAYTPGVARVCMAIHEEPEDAYKLTMKSNAVGVVSDGTAVLGLGDIGPLAALPVMEGKAQLFSEFADVNAFPVCLDTTDVDEIVETIVRIAPVLGGVNLEDISAPRCFEVERRLKERLDIPVFHDDQHGTAVVTTAALINALKVVGKKPEDLKVVLVGIGAAGTAVTKMIQQLGVENIIGFDSKGAVSTSRDDLNDAKRAYAEATNPQGITGPLSEVIEGADLFIGLSAPGVLTVEDVKKMADDPIVFAMANPTPEIMPEVAYPHVAVMATGRSDYPNQINNVLCFPGIFKGALACRAHDINEEMKMAAARAIAEAIPEENLTADYIVPSVFDRQVVVDVAKSVEEAARATGSARKGI